MFGIQQSTLQSLENTLTNILSYNPNHTYTLPNNRRKHSLSQTRHQTDPSRKRTGTIQTDSKHTKKHNYTQYISHLQNRIWVWQQALLEFW